VATCNRCRCRSVRTIETETTSGPADDGLCQNCAKFSGVVAMLASTRGFADLDSPKGVAEVVRVFLATCMPDRGQLRQVSGPRHSLAEHLAEKAGRAMTEFADFLRSDREAEPAPGPNHKPWVRKESDS